MLAIVINRETYVQVRRGSRRRVFPVEFWGPTIVYDGTAPGTEGHDPLAPRNGKLLLDEFLDLQLDAPMQNVGTVAEPAFQVVNPRLLDFLSYWGPVWQDREARFPVARKNVTPPRSASRSDDWDAEVDLSNLAHQPGKVGHRRRPLWEVQGGFVRDDPLYKPPPAYFGDRTFHDDLLSLGSLQEELRIWIQQAMYGLQRPGSRRRPLTVVGDALQRSETEQVRWAINGHLRWLAPAVELTDRGHEVVWQSVSLVPFLYLQVATRFPSGLLTRAVRWCEHCGVNPARRRYCSDHCGNAARSTVYYRSHRERIRARRTARVG